MLFSSPIFLFLFLPLALLGYYLAFKRIKNYWLLLVSLIFFAWGGVSYTAILIASIVFNYFFVRAIERNLNTRRGYWWLTLGVTCNVLTLGVFKYANFITKNLNILFDTISIPEIPETDIVLPIGISFYTFHLLSYLIDIYRGKAVAQKNIFDLALYVSMFSQLIAGPIIRYSDVWLQLEGRSHTLAKFSSGIERFIIGLGKKVLLANTFAVVADKIFAMQASELSALTAWLGIVCYSFQIYCDFSGYSDMAIGLGRMFGFEFMENFNYPFISQSVKEFWRRWHISLSSWFNDYVFTPFIINKRAWGKKAVVVGILFTFFLSGFWHGAGWNFIIFGLLHGIAIVYDFLTAKTRKKISDHMPKPVYTGLSILFTYVYVCFTWVFFRADTLAYATEYMAALFNFNTRPEHTALFMSFLNVELKAAFVLALLGASGFFNFIHIAIQKLLQSNKPLPATFAFTYHTASLLVYAGILMLCTMYLIAGTYNPFIYYKF